MHPQEGLTGLHLAAMHNDVDIAQELIGKGCPIDSQDEKVCSTILHTHSFTHNLLHTVNTAHTPQPATHHTLSPLQFGNSALHIAHERGSESIEQILREKGGESLTQLKNKVHNRMDTNSRVVQD